MPSSQEQLPRQAPVREKEKGKANAMEEDNKDNKNEVMKKICQELENFVVPTTELATLLPPSSEYFEK
ncbi:hypothetical protein C0995_001113 [Termitomyces sp. Mi166|nr:hypothetical protein C0995_001113 [Termitomyces sp. Mi166\